MLRFLTRMGILKYHNHGGYISTVFGEEELTQIKTNAGGLYRRLKSAGEEVHMGEVIAEILHPYEGEVISKILAPTEGIIFFAHRKPLVTESEVVYKIIRRLYE